MSEIVVQGIFVLGAAALGGVLGIIASKSGAEVEKLKETNKRLQQQVQKLLKQVEGYHLLEDLYARDLSGGPPSKGVKTIKTEYRNRVVELHQCSRPEMTANEAKRRLEDIA